jgi:hypothetical protein
MTFKHGVTNTLLDTPVRTIGTLANPIAYVGTAKTGGKTAGTFAATANKWTRLQTRAEALAWLGIDSASTQIEMSLDARADGYTVPGFLSAFHDDKNLADILVYNVAPSTDVTDEEQTLVSGITTLTYGYVSDLTVTNTAATTTYVENKDFTYDHKTGVVSKVSGGAITAGATILVDYTYATSAVASVDEDDVVAAFTAKDDIWQTHEVAPSMFIAPTFEELTADTTYKVISAMKTVYTLNDDLLASRAIVGIEGADKDAIEDTIVSAIATTHEDLDYVGHMAFGTSKLTASEMYALEWSKLATDNNGFIGQEPASNKLTTGTLPNSPFKDSDGNTLNEQGINTFVSFKGLRTWGNYTSKYDESGDFMDNFSSIRFLYNDIRNQVSVYVRDKMVDIGGDLKKIQFHIDTINSNIIGKAIRSGALLKGSRITLNPDDNPTEQLLLGQYVLDYGLGFKPPVTHVTNNFWYNVSLLTAAIQGV